MNIKYRLLCKRLRQERKRVGVIQYYNVLFIMELMTDKEYVSSNRWQFFHLLMSVYFPYFRTILPKLLLSLFIPFSRRLFQRLFSMLSALHPEAAYDV